MISTHHRGRRRRRRHHHHHHDFIHHYHYGISSEKRAYSTVKLAMNETTL